MWIDTHESWKRFLVRHLTEWMGQNRWSKATVVDQIVVAHKQIGGQAHSGVYFEPHSADEYNRMKANCTTFFRYVEDDDGEKNLFDILPSVLAAMPMELRLSFVSQYLRPAGLVVRPADETSEEGFTMEIALDTQSAAYDALRAVSTAALHPTPENLEIAERETEKANQKFKRTRALLSAARNACHGAKVAIGKVLHRGRSTHD